MNWDDIPKKIKEARIKQGMSQKDLAKLVGVSNVFICQIESSKKKPRVENLLKISKILNIKFF